MYTNYSELHIEATIDAPLNRQLREDVRGRGLWGSFTGSSFGNRRSRFYSEKFLCLVVVPVLVLRAPNSTSKWDFVYYYPIQRILLVRSFNGFFSCGALMPLSDVIIYRHPVFLTATL